MRQYIYYIIKIRESNTWALSDPPQLLSQYTCERVFYDNEVPISEDLADWKKEKIVDKAYSFEEAQNLLRKYETQTSL